LRKYRNSYHPFETLYPQQWQMNVIQLTQHVEQTHDAFQSYATKVINVGSAVYPQILGTLPHRLEAMTIQNTQLVKKTK
jgi:hypothetical protein